MLALAVAATRLLLGLAASVTLVRGAALDTTRDFRYHQIPQASLVVDGHVNETGKPFRSLTTVLEQGSSLYGKEEPSIAQTGTFARSTTVVVQLKCMGWGVMLWIKDTVKFIVGLALVAVSVPMLWFFERQRARVDCLSSTARSSCHSILNTRPCGCTKADPEKDGRLVHLVGERMRPTAAVRDPRFPNVVLKEDCVRLRTEVQVYQWVERRGTSQPGSKGDGKVDGGSMGWSSEAEHKQDKSRRAIPLGFRVGTTITNCGRVELGSGFVLPDALVDQSRGFEPAANLLGDSVGCAVTNRGHFTFQRHSDGFFYYRPALGPWSAADVAEAPNLGDVRVLFERVGPGPVTILALQVQAEGGLEHTFAPFRLVRRGLCGLQPEEERLALIAESGKTREQLAREDQCLPGSRLCCGCNLVARCCSGVLTPEIFKLFDGTRSAGQCLADAVPTSSFAPWATRALLWTSMFAGLLFVCFAVEIAVPWLRDLPIAQAMGSWKRCGLALGLTSATWLTILCLAYIFFRPLLAVLWFCLVSVVLVVPNVAALMAGGFLAEVSEQDDTGAARFDILPYHQHLRGFYSNSSY